ncbi:MAG: GNAT family N-acetyltransferase [Rhodobacteraceae bacterium]|nr:GNAT family N-acetyltransferase [Paracoccaceae bacterium]
MEIVWNSLRDQDWRPAALPLQQSRAYGLALAMTGAEVCQVAIRDAGGAAGHAQVVRRRLGPLRLSLLSRGPLWREIPAAGIEARALRCLGRAFPLVATPERPGLRAGLPLVTPRSHALWQITAAPGALRAGLDGKWRNRLVRAEATRLDLRLTRPLPGAIAWLLTADAARQRERGYRALPARFTHAWLAAAPEDALYTEAWAGGERVAAMLFLLHAPWASYHIGWTGEAGRRLEAHRLLLWRAALHLRERGIDTLDLGDVNTDGAPGLARFKIGTGARIASLGPTILIGPGGR